MNNRKIILFILLCIVSSLCFSQTKEDIMGFTLGEKKKDVIQKLANENYVFKTNDLSKEIFPLTIEIYQKQNLTFNKIPVEHISFSFCYDKLFCISIVTLPIDNLELLTDSRKILKQKYNFDKKNYIEINKEFYDTQANPAFYSCNDNQDFILIIYGKENYRGNIPQCYNFMYKSEADSAVELKNAFQTYSNISDYTELTLEELREKALILKKEEEEKQKFLEQKKLQEEKDKQIAREKQREVYNKIPFLSIKKH